MSDEESRKPDEEEQETPDDTEPILPSPPRHPVFAYMALLFAAAFLLLLFAYLMQQRDSEEIRGNLSDLRASMGSIQSIDQLVEENRALREEIDSLKEQAAALEEEYERVKKIIHDYEVELDGCTDAFTNVSHALDKVETAMGLFWQIDEAYVTEDFDLCQELVAQMEEWIGPDPSAYLAEPDGENGLTRSTAERYREIIEALEALKEAEG